MSMTVLRPSRSSSPALRQDLGTALARGSIAELITDRIPEVPGDVQLVGCLPTPMTNLGGLCLELLSGKGWSRPSLRELA